MYNCKIMKVKAYLPTFLTITAMIRLNRIWPVFLDFDFSPEPQCLIQLNLLQTFGFSGLSCHCH